jgi:hypothetical protein
MTTTKGNIAQPQLVKTPIDGLSFATRTTTTRGKWISDNYFDVPATEECTLHDYDVFTEMMRAVKEGGQKYTSMLVREVVIDAVRALNDPAQGLTRKWTAMGFLNLIDKAVRLSSDIDWDKFLEHRKASDAAYLSKAKQEERDRMAVLTRKSVEARRARKLEAQGL